ncbi:Nucleotide-binding universal stress protein, UspA family [Maridesulfovibrio ferrireducens]|uniref:Nucleotide-binding universal stress protein, UspA family n=1 Tax=Maridesulfovibrio ferrireducens TaxID=246191 RepID=A0A1G9LIU6_9BACT|nr:universal stress protein [Maridesulfovibrio ferrireducens]SDL61850.1 Nucleotide-binding universal stress protein, UspA family [Maridesulfovibrio ferrireducens]
MIFSKILIPVDGSIHSDNAVKYGFELAEMCEAKVILLHCHPPVPSGLGEPNFQKAIDTATRNSYAILQKYMDAPQAEKISLSDKTIGGDTTNSIITVSETEKCDLIIMGSKGKSDLEGLLIGSVTHKVLNTAHCPVLIIK